MVNIKDLDPRSSNNNEPDFNIKSPGVGMGDQYNPDDGLSLFAHIKKSISYYQQNQKPEDVAKTRALRESLRMYGALLIAMRAG